MIETNLRLHSGEQGTAEIHVWQPRDEGFLDFRFQQPHHATPWLCRWLLVAQVFCEIVRLQILILGWIIALDVIADDDRGIDEVRFDAKSQRDAS